MTDKFEIEPVVRLHSEDGACLEVGTDPDIPGLVEIRTPNQVSKEYFGDIRLAMDIPKTRQLIAALTHVCDAVEKFDGAK
jgi:hypothetical protein